MSSVWLGSTVRFCARQWRADLWHLTVLRLAMRVEWVVIGEGRDMQEGVV